MNDVTLIGNLGGDPELRYTNGGAAVCNFKLATNERFTDKDGNKQEQTEWHRIVVWGKQAEVCEKYLSKGKQVAIKGQIKTREWEDKDGNRRYTTEITARHVEFLGERGGGGRSGGSGGSKANDGRAPSNNRAFNDDDIPF